MEPPVASLTGTNILVPSASVLLSGVGIFALVLSSISAYYGVVVFEVGERAARRCVGGFGVVQDEQSGGVSDRGTATPTRSTSGMARGASRVKDDSDLFMHLTHGATADNAL